VRVYVNNNAAFIVEDLSDSMVYQPVFEGAGVVENDDNGGNTNGNTDGTTGGNDGDTDGRTDGTTGGENGDIIYNGDPDYPVNRPGGFPVIIN